MQHQVMKIAVVYFVNRVEIYDIK